MACDIEKVFFGNVFGQHPGARFLFNENIQHRVVRVLLTTAPNFCKIEPGKVCILLGAAQPNLLPLPAFDQVALATAAAFSAVFVSTVTMTVTMTVIMTVTMTLTAPGCGMGPVLVDDVKYRVGKVPGVETVEVELVFDPPWSREMMSEEAQLELGMV